MNSNRYSSFLLKKGNIWNNAREKLRALHPNEVIDGYLEKIRQAVVRVELG